MSIPKRPIYMSEILDLVIDAGYTQTKNYMLVSDIGKTKQDKTYYEMLCDPNTNCGCALGVILHYIYHNIATDEQKGLVKNSVEALSHVAKDEDGFAKDEDDVFFESIADFMHSVTGVRIDAEDLRGHYLSSSREKYIGMAIIDMNDRKGMSLEEISNELSLIGL